MKKNLCLAVFFLLVGFAPHVFAASNFVPLAGIPGLTQNVPATEAGLAGFFNNLYKYLIGIAAILAVIEIIWGGIRIATNQDNVSVLTDSKSRIWQAILGLVLVLSPALVFSIINPSILNLSLNIPKLDTATSTMGTANVPVKPTACTSNCDTGAKAGGLGVSAGSGIELYPCSGSDCSAAKKACSGGAQVKYDPVVVCASSDGTVDPNSVGATTCKVGENLTVNCVQTVFAN